MIPILYNKNETTFTHNGIGFLADASQCFVTEARNGEYECELEYPIFGKLFNEISCGSIVKAKANETSEPQLFRVYKVGKPFRGFVTYYANHISYDISGLPVAGLLIDGTTAQNAMNSAFGQSGIQTPFTALSDIDTLNSIKIEKPCSARAILGGQQGSVLDVWGGEYEFDNFVVKLHKERGKDNGVSIEYGKNLKDLKQEENIAETYTHIMPFATFKPESESEEEQEPIYIYLSERIIELPTAQNIGHTKCAIVDLSKEFADGEEVTETKLRAKAESYAQKTQIGLPKVNLKVSFVQLWQTTEYKNIAPLERVRLCDTVTVKFPDLGINVKAKVIETTYDSLKERFDSVEIGDAKSSFVDDIANAKNDLGEIKNQIQKEQSDVVNRVNSAVSNATQIITGQKGGTMVINPAYPAVPQEILSLDTGDINTAQSVWRWNNGGFGHSATGYNGEYSVALTADGRINADMITAGELDGQYIRAGSIKAEAIDVEFRNSFIRGGTNLIRNSSGLNGISEDWITSENANVEAFQNGDAISNTSAKSMFRIGFDSGYTEEMFFSQSIEVKQGTEYNFSLRCKTTDEFSYLIIRNAGENIVIFDFGQTETAIPLNQWVDKELTFTALGGTIEIEARRKTRFVYLADMMLVEGVQRSLWQPAPNEIYTSNTKIDGRGIRISNTESRTETRIDYREFSVYHNELTALSINKDLTTLRRTNVLGNLGIGEKGIFAPKEVGFDLIVLD